MIKVSVMYPNGPDARFDHEYYRTRHLPLIKNRMGAGLKYYAIDRGLSGAAPGTPAPYVAMCHLLCDSLAAYEASFGPHAKEIGADFLLRRHDYHVDVAGAIPVAQYVGDVVSVDGILFPTKRRAYMRAPDLSPIRDLLLVTIDFSNFRLTP